MDNIINDVPEKYNKKLRKFAKWLIFLFRRAENEEKSMKNGAKNIFVLTVEGEMVIIKKLANSKWPSSSVG